MFKDPIYTVTRAIAGRETKLEHAKMLNLSIYGRYTMRAKERVLVNGRVINCKYWSCPEMSFSVLVYNQGILKC